MSMLSLRRLPVRAPAFRRHARRAARRVAAATLTAAAVSLLLVVFAPPLAGSVALTVTAFVLGAGTCFVLGAHDADAAEERWLRHALGALRPDLDEDEEQDSDNDLLVY
jgi:hypothetical protein